MKAPSTLVASASRTAELLGALSLATDAAAGFAPETAIRTSIIATRLGRAVGLSDEDLRDCFYAGLLRYLGCTGYSHEQALANGGDDIEFLQIYADADLGNKFQMVGRTFKSLAAGKGAATRVKSVARFLGDPNGGTKVSFAHCAAANMLADRIGMSHGVLMALDQMYERWDGKGAPHRIAGEALSPVSRTLHAAQVIEVIVRISDPEAARGELRRRLGGHLDPAMVRASLEHIMDLTAGLSEPWVFDLFCQAEPSPVAELQQEDIPRVARAFANFADLKSVYMLGHSPLVSEICSASALGFGLNASEKAELAIAGLLHDLGRVSIPTGIWDKPTALSSYEVDRLKTHPTVLANVLNRTSVLRPLADLATAAQERLDGSGYPRRVPGAALTKPQRLLAAADVYAALTRDRPYRPAYSATQAAKLLGEEVSTGRLDRNAVRAVLDAEGVRRPSLQNNLPDELSLREAEVLCLLARGLSNKKIATLLNISPRTVQSHVMHIFEKTGIQGRAAAALYAVDNGIANIQHSGG